jgi:hypothetical protein
MLGQERKHEPPFCCQASQVRSDPSFWRNKLFQTQHVPTAIAEELTVFVRCGDPQGPVFGNNLYCATYKHPVITGIRLLVRSDPPWWT